MNPLGAALGAWVSALLGASSVFVFADPAITESSGLVDLGSLMVTTNDSGGDPLVFVVDRSGRTVGRTTFAASVTDVEALAPAGRDAVWVGDIGDNRAVRSSVQVYRVPVSRGDTRVHVPAYDLVYPDGPHDAESLVIGPDERLRIITKGILGGRVYTAPRRLDPNRPNRLVRGRSVDVWATDAALFRDGRHVLVRGYGDALVADYPSFRPVGRMDLPAQEQGEGVSIGPGGRIRLSSEGEHSEVLQVALPRALRQQLTSDGQGPPKVAPGAAPLTDPPPGARRWWLLGGVAGCGLGWLVIRRRR